MSMDSITEAIAHFIGFFHTTLEHGRMREAYKKFLVEQAEREDEQTPSFVEAQFDARFDLQSYVPILSYEAPAPLIVMYYPWSNVFFASPQVEIPWDKALYPGWVVPKAAIAGAAGSIVLPQIEPLGSVVSMIFQKAYLPTMTTSPSAGTI